MIYFFSVGKTHQEDIFCGPCLYVDIQTKATRYCKTCSDPEPLCNDCAKQHTRQNSSRDHELCNDIKGYQIIKKTINAK